MKILEYNRDQAHSAFDKWKNDNELPSLSQDYIAIRNDLIQFFADIYGEVSGDDRKEYMTDTLFGLKIYDYFRNKDWFNLRTAANDNFWRYISVGVIPNIVAKRWGTNKDNYFWKQSNRLWPKTTWWYIHLTWHNSLEETRNILLDKRFNSDTIQGLVERTGKKGTFVDVYREIVYQYSLLDYNTIVKFKKQLSGGSDNLFRAIMRLNTARNLVTDPCLTKGGVCGYVSSIIYDLTINL